MKDNPFMIILILCCIWGETISRPIQLPTNSTLGGPIDNSTPAFKGIERRHRVKRWARYGNRVWNDTIKIGYANYANRYIYSKRDQDQILKECTDVSLKKNTSTKTSSYFQHFWLFQKSKSPTITCLHPHAEIAPDSLRFSLCVNRGPTSDSLAIVYEIYIYIYIYLKAFARVWSCTKDIAPKTLQLQPKSVDLRFIVDVDTAGLFGVWNNPPNMDQQSSYNNLIWTSQARSSRPFDTRLFISTTTPWSWRNQTKTWTS